MNEPVGWTRELEDGMVDVDLLYWTAVRRVEYLKGYCEAERSGGIRRHYR